MAGVVECLGERVADAAGLPPHACLGLAHQLPGLLVAALQADTAQENQFGAVGVVPVGPRHIAPGLGQDGDLRCA